MNVQKITIDLETLEKALTELAELFGWPQHINSLDGQEAFVRQFHGALQGKGRMQTVDAIRQARRSCRRFPMPADILELMSDVIPPADVPAVYEPEAEGDWADCADVAKTIQAMTDRF